MKIEKISDLKEGDVVKHVSDHIGFRVIAVYGERATAVRVQDITNPSEWEVIARVENRWV